MFARRPLWVSPHRLVVGCVARRARLDRWEEYWDDRNDSLWSRAPRAHARGNLLRVRGGCLGTVHGAPGGQRRVARLWPRLREHANPAGRGGLRSRCGRRAEPDMDLLHELYGRWDRLQHDPGRVRRMRVHRLLRRRRLRPRCEDRSRRLAAQAGSAQSRIRRGPRRRGRDRRGLGRVPGGRVHRALRDRAEALDWGGRLEERALRAAAHELRSAGGLLHEFQPGPRKRVHRRRLLASRGQPDGHRRLRADQRENRRSREVHPHDPARRAGGRLLRRGALEHAGHEVPVLGRRKPEQQDQAVSDHGRDPQDRRQPFQDDLWSDRRLI